MKTIIVSLWVLISTLTINAQRNIEKEIKYDNQVVHLEFKFAKHIQLETWDKPVIYLKGDFVTENNNYLEDIRIDVEKKDGAITISSNTEALFLKYVKESKDKQRELKAIDFDYEFNYVVYLPKNVVAKLSSHTGNLESNRLEGDFNIDLSTGHVTIKKWQGTLNVKTIGGDVSVNPLKSKVIAETVEGEIYADESLTFKITDGFMVYRAENDVKTDKSKLKIRTFRGNIYLKL